MAEETRTTLFSARPALSINGTSQPELDAALQTLVVEETAAGLARCRARF